jgi:hypothetical protein
MARNLYSVSPGERPVLVREAVQLTEKVVFIDDEITTRLPLWWPNQRAGLTRSARRSSCSTRNPNAQASSEHRAHRRGSLRLRPHAADAANGCRRHHGAELELPALLRSLVCIAEPSSLSCGASHCAGTARLDGAPVTGARHNLSSNRSLCHSGPKPLSSKRRSASVAT